MHFSGDSNEYLVRVGSAFHRSGGSVVSIERIVPHPNFNHDTSNFDFALLELVQPLTFCNKIKPIALANANTVVADGTWSLITGWGKRNQFDEIKIIR